MQRLLDPRPGDVFLTLRHPPEKTVSLALGATRPRRPKCPKQEFPDWFYLLGEHGGPVRHVGVDVVGGIEGVVLHAPSEDD